MAARKKPMQPACADAQRGFLLITAVVLIVIGALLLSVMVFFAVTGNQSGTGNLQSGQALFLAESGLEYEQRRMALNADWFRSSTDPTASSGPQTLGAGTFIASSNLTATELRKHMDLSTTTLCVYTVQRFPSSGWIQIGNDMTIDAEFVSYTNTTSSSAACNSLPAFTGISRGVAINGYPASPTSRLHNVGDFVYPVTTLIDALSASATCVAPSQLRITDNSKFLSSGTISLDNGTSAEDVSYTGSSRSGGVMTLTGLTRLLGTNCVAWAANFPVTPQLSGSSGGSSANQEAQAVATGTVGGTQRTANMTIQR